MAKKRKAVKKKATAVKTEQDRDPAMEFFSPDNSRRGRLQ